MGQSTLRTRSVKEATLGRAIGDLDVDPAPGSGRCDAADVAESEHHPSNKNRRNAGRILTVAWRDSGPLAEPRATAADADGDDRRAC